MLLVQKFLETQTLKELEEKHGVECTIQDYKVSLNYNQITSKSSDKLANDCRGLILRNQFGFPIKNNEPIGKTKLLAKSFPRFFNYGDGHCAKIDWNSIRCEEKLDGTLCLVYFDDIKKEYCVATRSVPEANLPIGFKDYTFRTLFEKAVYETYGLKWSGFINNLHAWHTYSFELTTPLNQIVVRHNNYNVSLLTIFDNDKLTEVERHRLDLFPFKTVPTYELKTIDQIIEFVNLRNPSENEGLVLVDKDFNRIKVKSVSYVAAHKLRDTTSSDRNCLALILEEKLDDAIVHLPQEVQDHLSKMAEGFKNHVLKNEEYYKIINEKSLIGSEKLSHDAMKSFADILSRTCLDVRDLDTAAMFAIKREKATSVLDYYRSKKIKGKYPHPMLDRILENMGYK